MLKLYRKKFKVHLNCLVKKKLYNIHITLNTAKNLKSVSDPRYIDHSLVLDDIEEKRQLEGGISDFYLLTTESCLDDIFSLLKESAEEKFRSRVKVVDVEELD